MRGIPKKFSEFWNQNRERLLVTVLPRRYANLLQASKGGLWDKYFADAERDMNTQWDSTIWPLIKDFSFDMVLELAPGAGRNTEKLSGVSRQIIAVDLNSYALEQCRKRLGATYQGCKLEYHVNNGTNLGMIPDGVVTTIYCWDAAVHFDKGILGDYIKEFSRVLKVDGRGFVHHSNLGAKADKNIKKNPHWRSNMSKADFAAMCETNGLSVLMQVDIPWDNIVDCATIFQKRPR